MSALMVVMPVLVELRQVVGDLEPRRLRADEDVLGRANCRNIDERPHGDVNERAVPHNGEEEGAALRAAGVVQVFLPEDRDGVQTLGDLERLALGPGEPLKAEPVAARQFEQWQFAAYRNASATA